MRISPCPRHKRWSHKRNWKKWKRSGSPYSDSVELMTSITTLLCRKRMTPILWPDYSDPTTPTRLLRLSNVGLPGQESWHWDWQVGSQVLSVCFHTLPHVRCTEMLHELMWENYYHWIYIFLVFTPTSVQTVSKCSKVDVCKCSTDEGTIDLWSLAGTPSNIPRFGYDLFLLDTDFRKILVSYEAGEKFGKCVRSN